MVSAGSTQSEFHVRDRDREKQETYRAAKQTHRAEDEKEGD